MTTDDIRIPNQFRNPKSQIRNGTGLPDLALRNVLHNSIFHN